MAGNTTTISNEEKTFKQVEYHIQEAQNLLKKEALRLRQEREAFDVVAKKLEHVHFSSTVKLNVGGQIFTTSLQTLTKDAGSMLHAMFSGRFDTKPSEDGSYFIDRDGTCFRYILNYLRTGKLNLPEDKLIQKDVLEEAIFYQIQAIVDELNPKHYSDSTILSSEQADWLVNVHGDEKRFSKCRLLYRGSRDGWSSSMFHAKCDLFNGPTMVVIKSGKGYVFGGYTEQSWAGSGFKEDHAAFLFSLVSPGGANSVQVKAVQNQESAIYCDKSCGPTFGGASIPVVNNPGTTSFSFGGLQNRGFTGVPLSSSTSFPIGGSTNTFGMATSTGHVESQPRPDKHDLAVCSNPQSTDCILNLHHTYLCPGRFAAFMAEGSSGTNTPDDTAFLFSLVNYVGTKPTKMNVKPGMPNAIICSCNCGPVFGGGHDMLIANEPNSQKCSVKLGTTYDCPPGQKGTTFLTGHHNFLVSEMEMFELVVDTD